MDALIVDWGSYSLKFLELKIEKKRLVIANFSQIVLSEFKTASSDSSKAQDDLNLDLDQIKSELVGQYLKEINFDGKLVFQYPATMLTNRFLTLPVANKKKAELMIPFQLEENLPFSLANIHYISNITKEGNNSKALVQIAELKIFDEFHALLSRNNSAPAVLTSDLSIIQHYANLNLGQKKDSAPILILDLGHRTTKAYFIHDGQVVANHLSHIAGELINTIISQAYDLSLDDAILYKHENCFLLTEGQYQEVEPEQKEFAELMQQALWPLILDLKRWILGFRARWGQAVESIHLMGGTSQIRNIDNFIAHAIGVQVNFWTEESPVELYREGSFSGDLRPLPPHAFGMTYLMSYAQASKEQLDNFLVGPYTSKYNQNISLHSSSFIFSRVALLCLILGLTLLAERFAYLNPEIKALDIKVTQLLKQPTLNVPARNRKLYARRPESILSGLIKEQRTVTREIKELTNSAQIDALTPLVKLGNILPRKIVTLTKFKAAGTKTQIEVQADDSEKISSALDRVEKDLNNAALKSLDIKRSSTENRLIAIYSNE